MVWGCLVLTFTESTVNQGIRSRTKHFVESFAMFFVVILLRSLKNFNYKLAFWTGSKRGSKTFQNCLAFTPPGFFFRFPCFGLYSFGQEVQAVFERYVGPITACNLVEDAASITFMSAEHAQARVSRLLSGFWEGMD